MPSRRPPTGWPATAGFGRAASTASAITSTKCRMDIGMTETATAHEIEIRRVYDAPRELVWRAGAEPGQLVPWWGPPRWGTPPETGTMEGRGGRGCSPARRPSPGRRCEKPRGGEWGPRSTASACIWGAEMDYRLEV